MKNRKKPGRLEECMFREYEYGMEAAGRFCSAQTASIPCGRSPGMFISELFRMHNNLGETDPFAELAANEEAVFVARRISALSREENAGGCVVSFDKKMCDANGRRYMISDDAFVQIQTGDPDIYCSLILDAAETFAADVFADSFAGSCFMMINVAGSGRICVPLEGFRILSVEKQKPRREICGWIVEYGKSLPGGINDSIVCGPALWQVQKVLGTDVQTNETVNRIAEK